MTFATGTDFSSRNSLKYEGSSQAWERFQPLHNTVLTGRLCRCQYAANRGVLNNVIKVIRFAQVHIWHLPNLNGRRLCLQFYDDWTVGLSKEIPSTLSRLPAIKWCRLAKQQKLKLDVLICDTTSHRVVLDVRPTRRLRPVCLRLTLSTVTVVLGHSPWLITSQFS